MNAGRGESFGYVVLHLARLTMRVKLRRYRQGTHSVDQQLQRLMKELGEAINESLSDSEQIAEVIARIKAGGYDVFLVLEATIGFNKHDEEDETIDRPALVNSRRSDPDLKMSAQDVKFLKSLRISIDSSDKAA
ncbi:MAG TPA: hypothetical protein VN622_12980 [Clostridia bacterium]|nr:hypothetical protein [Clostridia bacterium]